jgi:2-hydroxy-3-keto-5-methylthiopentenyl-1-phosphate phosphatase
MDFPHLSAEARKRPLAVFSDFDGTITHPDTLNFLAETYGGKEFRRGIGRKIASGEISLRNGIQDELAVIRGSLEENLTYLRQHVVIDPEFPAFAHWCEARKIELTILSGGMKEVIEELLAPLELHSLKIEANHLVISSTGRWSLEFLDETDWGHDKGAALRKARQQGLCTVFLGDGLSDRGAAENADIIFTKGSLASFCDAQEIPHLPFNSFADVQAHLTSFLQNP